MPKFFFLEYGHQIKGNDTYIKLLANVVPRRHTVDRRCRWGSNIFSLNEVILHIKLMGMKRRAPCKQIVCHYIHSRSLGCCEKVKTFFSESSHVAYQIKGKEV